LSKTLSGSVRPTHRVLILFQNNASSTDSTAIVNARDGRVRVNVCVFSENYTGVCHDIASQLTIFAKNRPEFSDSAIHCPSRKPSYEHISTVVSKVAQLAASTEIYATSKNRITDVVEVWRFGVG
jgi:hypothetical protein